MSVLEQRVLFGLDPPREDRWPEPLWPGLDEDEGRRRRHACCRCRVTRWTVLWSLVSSALVPLCLYIAVAPYWIVRGDWVTQSTTGDNSTGGRGSVGLFRQCWPSEVCRTFSLDHMLSWDLVPGLWLSVACLASLATLLATVAALAGPISCCTRYCGCANIYKTAGTLHILTVLCHVIAAVVYPMDWGAPVMRRLCGPETEAFVLDQCSIGWCIYALMLATVLNLICAALAAKIDANTPEFVELRVKR